MMNRFGHNSGFTLIEMIVSLALFSIVVTTAVGALLSLLSANKQLQGEQAIMTNLTFALDSMTREIRTGYNYHCYSSDTDPTNLDQNTLSPTLDCVGLSNSDFVGISFFEGGNSITGSADRIMYYFRRPNGTIPGAIMRKVGNEKPYPILSSTLEVIEADFRVTGTDRLAAPGSDRVQPTVTISIRAREAGVVGGKEYRLQTTVTQRTLDL